METGISNPIKKLSRIKFTKKTIIIIIAVVLLVVAAVSLLAYRTLTTYRFTEQAVYSVMDFDFDVPAGSTAKVDENGKTVLHIKGQEDLDVDEAGVFFVESPKMLTIKPMSYYCANQTDMLQGKQITPLTEVTCEYGLTAFSRNGKKLEEEGDFLYDGDNTYITLRDAQLIIGDEKITDLPALSYVISCYRNWVAYRDHDTGKYVYIHLVDTEAEEYKEVKLYFDSDKLTVVCDRDRAISPYDNFMLTTAITRLEEVLK